LLASSEGPVGARREPSSSSVNVANALPGAFVTFALARRIERWVSGLSRTSAALANSSALADGNGVDALVTRFLFIDFGVALLSSSAVLSGAFAVCSLSTFLKSSLLSGDAVVGPRLADPDTAPSVAATSTAAVVLTRRSPRSRSGLRARARQARTLAFRRREESPRSVQRQTSPRCKPQAHLRTSRTVACTNRASERHH
jgi:hypothetical protein